MTDPLTVLTSILQFVDTALKLRSQIQDFHHAPQEQQRLLSEMDILRPLLVRLQSLVTENTSSEVVEEMGIPLAKFESAMKPLAEKLSPGGGLFSKFFGRIKWANGDKQEAEKYLDKFEQYKSLLNSWLLLDLRLFYPSSVDNICTQVSLPGIWENTINAITPVSIVTIVYLFTSNLPPKYCHRTFERYGQAA
jgi:hypothetical protein